jgi:hypothetical protein
MTLIPPSGTGFSLCALILIDLAPWSGNCNTNPFASRPRESQLCIFSEAHIGTLAAWLQICVCTTEPACKYSIFIRILTHKGFTLTQSVSD